MKTFVTLASALVITLVAVFILPAVNTLPVCKINVANAQDNPCLAQEATISALENSVLRLEATNVALQSTVDANQTPLSGDFPFREDFNTNERGWDILDRNEGTAFVQDGALSVVVNDRESFNFLVPDLILRDEYYLEADMFIDTPGYGTSGIGFWIGDYVSNRYHKFILASNGVRFYDGQNIIAEVQRGMPSNGFILALESYEGVYTLYVDGEPMLAEPITPYGNQIGIVVESYGTGGSKAASVDTLIIRETR